MSGVAPEPAGPGPRKPPYLLLLLIGLPTGFLLAYFLIWGMIHAVAGRGGLGT